MATKRGTRRKDRLLGTRKKDRLAGLGGNDILLGLEGNDFLDGGKGKDSLQGSKGNDTYIVDNSADRVLEKANQGIDTVQSSVSWTLGSNLENLTLKGGQSLNGTGNSLDNILIGNSGNNILNGSGGNDVLTGGGGGDRFFLNPGGVARVTDFNQTEDVIQLSGSRSEYVLVENVPGLSSGTAIYFDQSGTEPDELVGVVQNILGLNLDEAYFSFTVPTPPPPTQPGIVSFTVDTSSGAEGNSGISDTLVATLQRTGGSDGTVSVQVELESDSTATPGSDYTNILPLTITFASGETTKTIVIPIVGDTGFEPHETLKLRLVAPTGGATLGTAITTYTLLNDDSVPNTPPVAVNDALPDVTILLNSRLTIPAVTLLANDTDVDAGQTLMVMGVANPTNGTVFFNSLTGSITFRGAASGLAGFDYRISDGNGGTAIARATFNLTSTGLINLENVVSGTGLPVGIGGFAINGISNGNNSGSSVSSAGDVNGDGLDDLMIGAPDAAAGGNQGQSYVVFGKTTNSLVNLSDVASGIGGFAINGGSNSGNSESVSSAGDVNGDGFADLIIGADLAAAGGTQRGRSYIVFGKTTGTAVNLSSVVSGTGGFAINGINDEDKSGSSVSSAGDVNGDGLDDLIVGAPAAAAGGNGNGQSYVVFGKTTGTIVNLSDVVNGTGGFAINGVNNGDSLGSSVSSAGDVNGDGLDDLIVGAPNAAAGGNGSGQSYVVFGKTTGTIVNLSDVVNGTGGFAINGSNNGDYSGNSVSSAGDVNGDGLDDLIVGANFAASGGIQRGQSYVVFGKTTGAAINLSDVINGVGGFAINGISDYDNSGSSVSSAGDVNGDGLDDLMIGAPSAASGGTQRGQSYVVFGKTTGVTVNLGDVVNGIGGFVINGINDYDSSGRSVSRAGDVNGDGFDDLIVGAPSANLRGSDRGQSYVVFGGDFTTAVTQLGTDGTDILTGTANSQALVGAQGADTLSDGGFTNSLLYGGAGSDVLKISNTSFKRLDGDTGIDTLLLDGSAISLDLSAIAPTRISGIDQIDLTGSGNNRFAFQLTDLHTLSDTNQLILLGNAGDTVTSSGQGWVSNGTTALAGNLFSNYTSGSFTLLVDTDITQTIS